ncbi:MAG TPA: undecaprenyl-diphosphate phosphatase [Solirubrobacteraceae bacterium]|nr:undecaprenyl-diphosphate phosphatase [Solirubrobacteraceae bacterium]
MPPPRPEPPLAQALALGLLQGPAELLPVSSSAHVTLLPWLAGRPLPTDPELRKAFEVALHAGTAAALLGHARAAARRPALTALATLPPALAGLAFERAIERRLGTPRGIALGLLAGGAAMAIADACGGRRRVRADATRADALALGLAQAAALVPGLSRNGMTLAAARARGFAPAEAQALSWEVALPTLAGAAALKALRLARCGLPARAAAALAAGALAAFASTLAARPLLRRDGPLLPFAAYRAALAGLVLRRVRENPAR